MSTNPLTVTAPDGVPFIDFEREFDAPVAAVFRAHAEPELLTQWLGPRGYEMKIDHYEFRTGGGYRYLHTDQNGEAYAFNGVFHTVRPNEFAIQTFEFEGFPDVVSIESMTFEDLGGGRSRVRGHSVFPSLEARDGMVASGMEGGMSEGYERLDGPRQAELNAATTVLDSRAPHTTLSVRGVTLDRRHLDVAAEDAAERGHHLAQRGVGRDGVDERRHQVDLGVGGVLGEAVERRRPRRRRCGRGGSVRGA